MLFRSVKQEISSILAREVPEGIQAKVDRVAYLDDAGKQLLAVVPISGTLGTQSGNRLILPRLFFGSREGNPFPTNESRILPVDMGFPAQEQEQVTYVLPAGFGLEVMPPDEKFTFENNAAFQLRTKINGASVTNARILARGFTLLEAKDYGQLRDFYQKVVTAERQQLVVSGVHPAGE